MTRPTIPECNRIRNQYGSVTTAEVVEAISEDELSTEDLYAVGVTFTHADSTDDRWNDLGRVILELTRRVANLEDELKAAKADPDRVTRRASSKPKQPQPKAPEGVVAPKCEACGGPTVLRRNRDGGNFWGCCAYPNCKKGGGSYTGPVL